MKIVKKWSIISLLAIAAPYAYGGASMSVDSSMVSSSEIIDDCAKAIKKAGVRKKVLAFIDAVIEVSEAVEELEGVIKALQQNGIDNRVIDQIVDDLEYIGKSKTLALSLKKALRG